MDFYDYLKENGRLEHYESLCEGALLRLAALDLTVSRPGLLAMEDGAHRVLEAAQQVRDALTHIYRAVCAWRPEERGCMGSVTWWREKLCVEDDGDCDRLAALLATRWGPSGQQFEDFWYCPLDVER